MNICKYSTNNLLKVTLIFGIALSAVNSISVNVVAQPESGTGKTNNSNNSNQQNESKDTSTETPNDIKSSEENSESTKSSGTTESEKQKATDDQKMLTIKDILLFINLPILTTLLLLWFLTQKQQQEQIDRLTKNQNKIISNFSQFNEITNKLNNLDKINSQIIGKIQDSDQKNLDSEVRLREFLSKQQFNQSVNYHNSLTSDISNLNSIAIVDKISQFVETYNQDKNSIADKAKAMVAETQASLNQRRSGNSDTVTLENTTQKKYCVIEEDNDYYLIPHAKIKIDEYNRTTLESLFNCTNFTSEYSDFQLVKLAKVSQLSSETWQLEEKGQLDFY